MTKASGGMTRHKCNGEWCLGSGISPGSSELLHEQKDLSVYVWSDLGRFDDILDWKVGTGVARNSFGVRPVRHEGELLGALKTVFLESASKFVPRDHFLGVR